MTNELRIQIDNILDKTRNLNPGEIFSYDLGSYLEIIVTKSSLTPDEYAIEIFDTNAHEFNSYDELHIEKDDSFQFLITKLYRMINEIETTEDVRILNEYCKYDAEFIRIVANIAKRSKSHPEPYEFNNMSDTEKLYFLRDISKTYNYSLTGEETDIMNEILSDTAFWNNIIHKIEKITKER